MAGCHGVLIQISLGYPPVRGRSHTRYAPVRRSPPSEDVLPLDLHVLGLPLAFILSQDQTLHRCILYTSRRPVGLPSGPALERSLIRRPRGPPYAVNPICQSTLPPRGLPFGGCKYSTFFRSYKTSAGLFFPAPWSAIRLPLFSGCKYTPLFLPSKSFDKIF